MFVAFNVKRFKLPKMLLTGEAFELFFVFVCLQLFLKINFVFCFFTLIKSCLVCAK